MKRIMILIPCLLGACAAAIETRPVESTRAVTYRGQEIMVSWTPRSSDLVMTPGEGEATLTHPAGMALTTEEAQRLMAQATGCAIRKDVVGFGKSGTDGTITLPMDC